MLNLIFASNNENKILELRRMLKELNIENVEITSLKDLNLDIEVDEDMPTLEENAIKKAENVYNACCKGKSNKLVFAEDFGFFIEELPKVAGIHSHRWFKGTDDDRNNQVLKLMTNVENRKCYYKTSFAIYDGKIERVFSGYTYGTIATEKRGVNGFAYDSIFQLEEGMTIAELEPEEKDEISCRRDAFEAMLKAILEDDSLVMIEE